MTDECDDNGDLLPDEVRMTKVGKFVRSSSIDELPQLINILKGDMALIEPRPLLPEYLPLYNKEQARRHEVRPGISGWAQCHGYNAISWEEKFKLDIWYVDHISLWTGRYGQPKDIAHAIIYLLSDASRWVIGSNLVID